MTQQSRRLHLVQGLRRHGQQLTRLEENRERHGVVGCDEQHQALSRLAETTAAFEEHPLDAG